MALLNFDTSPHGGKHKLLPEWNSQPHITPTTIIDHSIVGSAAGAWFMFRDSTGIESHFIIDLNGEIWQLMDTGRQADANLNANSFGISIETADNGNPNDFPWTNAQLASLKWLHNKLRAVHPTIPRKECVSSFGGGLGFHSKFPPGTANPWSPVMKTCPGKPARMAQWEDELLPAFVSGTVEEDDMTPEQAKQLDTLFKAFIVQGTTTPEQTVNILFNRIRTIEDALRIQGTSTVEEGMQIQFDRVRTIANRLSAGPDEKVPLVTDTGKGLAIDPTFLSAVASAVADELASRSQQ